MEFRVILADPPWHYADQKKVRKDTKVPTAGIGACHHYSQMKTDEIVDLTWLVQSVTAERCHLYLWATMPLLPDALRVMTGWGFKFCTVAFCWVKCNSRRFDDAILDVLQPALLDTGRTVRSFLDVLTFFGPGFYTGSNVELVLLGRRGRPFKHAEGCKASQVVYAPLGEHSAKPEEVQRRIEWMYPDVIPRLEMFARRDREGWTCLGDEGVVEPEDIRVSLKRLAIL